MVEKDISMSVRVRFAPSPTGSVHIGNIRTAIFNWLFARHEGGKFLLRIEDTDRERHTQEAVDGILDVMSWLGLDYDEEPVYQSQRIAAHVSAAEKLLKGGHAYAEDKGGTGKGECVVFKMPGDDMVFTDVIKGALCKKAEDLTDFVILRSDGSPTFHLANVVDDIDMGITHIIRGDDHTENTYRHVAMYRALQADVPMYAHLPMIVNQQGKPYSKRDGDCFVGQFRERGFLPQALVNYLALLGWSPGDDREKMSIRELVESFALDRVKSSPAQMDIQKLTHLNAEYVTQMPLDEFVGDIRQSLADREWAVTAGESYFGEVCALMQSRTHLYPYAAEWKYFFSDDIDYDEKAVRKNLRKDGCRDALSAAQNGLEGCDWTLEGIEGAIRTAESERGIKEGKLNQPIRVAVTGLSRGAGLYETLVLLGRQRCVNRLEYAAENLCD